MTNAETVPEETPPVEPDMVEELNTTPDPLLRAMVWVVADQSQTSEIGLTLHVSGVVVSGILVSASSFFDHLARWLADNGSQDLADNFATPMADMLRESRADREKSGAGSPADAHFIHLREAQVFSSGADRPLPKTLWRGRLSHVSAWSIGVMSASPG